MSFHQHILLLTRVKLDKEASAGEPRLLRILACVNMVDQCTIASRLTGDGHVRQSMVEERYKDGRQCLLAGNNHPSRTTISAASTQVDKNTFTQTIDPVQPIPTSSRPRASSSDRMAFRRSINHGSILVDDSAVGSDTESIESDSSYSDDEDDGSDPSSEDDTECELQLRVAKPARKGQAILLQAS